MTSHLSRSAKERVSRYLQKKNSITVLDQSQATIGMINNTVQGPVFMTPLSSQRGLAVRQREEATKFENTYKMAPSNAFPENKIKRLVENVLTRELNDAAYEAENCRRLTGRISDIIKTQIKDLELERYKLVCIVHIGQRGNQEVKVGSRCLWDVRLDTFTSVEYQNKSLFAIATVFAVYFE